MRTRDLRRSSISAALLLSIMLLGGVVLWVGLPASWFYVGGQVQAATNSIGSALAVMAVGIAVSIAVMLPALGWLSRKHAQSRVARGFDDPGQTALEAVMVISAAIALLAFVVWFFLFSGAALISTGGGNP